MKNLRKPLLYFGIFAMFAMFFASCRQTPPAIDRNMLEGKWQLNNAERFYRFNLNGTGVEWDEADQVLEHQGTPLVWILNGAVLEVAYLDTITDFRVEYDYRITRLTETNLQWRDEFNRLFSFTRVE